MATRAVTLGDILDQREAMMGNTVPFPPKMLRFAEAGVVSMQADGLLDAGRLAVWDAWRRGVQPAPGPDRKVPVPAGAADLFKEALAREARRLEASLAVRDDPDDGNDLSMIREFVPA